MSEFRLREVVLDGPRVVREGMVYLMIGKTDGRSPLAFVLEFRDATVGPWTEVPFVDANGKPIS